MKKTEIPLVDDVNSTIPVQDIKGDDLPIKEIGEKEPKELIANRAEVEAAQENDVQYVVSDAEKPQEIYPTYPNGQLKFDNLSPKKASQIIQEQIAASMENKKITKPITNTKGTFTYKDKKYIVLLPQVRIAEMGVLTALDILSDEAAQAYLVENNTLGSVIQEVIE